MGNSDGLNTDGLSDQSERRLVFFITCSITVYMFKVDRKRVKHYGTRDYGYDVM